MKCKAMRHGVKSLRESWCRAECAPGRDGRRTNVGRRRPWPSPDFLHPKSDGPDFGFREKWRRSGDYTMLKGLFDPSLPWFENLTVRLDLGFWDIEKDYGPSSKIILSHKKPRESKTNPFPELTSHQKKENRKRSKARIFVEQAIGGMKHFHCLTHRIRNRSISLIN